ncbi:CocE/NonD family hydrolase [bacterium]|nr:CocE/NonD family hydrolase [bacterium]
MFLSPKAELLRSGLLTVLLCGLLSALASCGGGSARSDSEPGAQPRLSPPAATQLPNLQQALEEGRPQAFSLSAAPGLQPLANPAQRRASSVDLPLDLNQANLLGSTVDAGGLHLDSTDGSLSAAYFVVNVDYNDRAVQFLAPYRLTPTRGAGDGAVWVGFADFKTGRWVFSDAPLTEFSRNFDVYLDRNSADYQGRFLFCLAVQSGQSADITALSLEYPDAPAPGEAVRYLQPITARDGTLLGTDIYLPYFYNNAVEEQLAPPPHPAVLVRTPYDKAEIDPTLINLAPQTYTVALVQYFRGRRFDSGQLPDSGGEESLFRDHAGPDHFDSIDTVDWLEGRNFYNGQLALYGISALGIATWQSLPELGSRVDFVFTQISAADPFGYAAFQNGCFAKYNMEGFLGVNQYPASLLDEALSAYASQDSAYFSAVDFNSRAAEVQSPGIHETGWWDADVEETIRSWRAVNSSGGAGAAGQQQLVIGPWSHSTLRGNEVGILSFPDTDDLHDPGEQPSERDGFLLALSSLGRYLPLAAPDNKVYYYIIGNEGSTAAHNNVWRESSDWPPPEASLSRTWYMDLGTLEDAAPVPENLATWQGDPVDPMPTLGGALLPFGLLPQGPQDVSPLLLRNDCVLWTSAALAEDTTLAGEALARLNVIPHNDDTDIVVRLIDIYPDNGQKIPVAENIVRLSWYLEQQGQGPPQAFQEYSLDVSIGQRAYTFAAGHAIGLMLCSADYPRYELNPGNGNPLPDGETDEFLTVDLREGGAEASSLTLQILPQPVM